MALWPDEYEDLRGEARAMASALVPRFDAFVGDAVPTDRADDEGTLHSGSDLDGLVTPDMDEPHRDADE